MLISDVIILLRYPLSQPDGCQLSQRESQERCGASATYLFAGLGWYAQNDLFPMNAKNPFSGKTRVWVDISSETWYTFCVYQFQNRQFELPREVFA